MYGRAPASVKSEPSQGLAVKLDSPSSEKEKAVPIRDTNVTSNGEIMHNFENKLDNILNEYSLSGDDFGPTSNYDPVRHSQSMRADSSTTIKDLQDASKRGIQNVVTPAEDEGGIPVRLSYAVYNVYQRYWEGQNDPLYALLSRRGGSVDWVTVFLSPDELDRLKEVTQEIMEIGDKTEKATAKSLQNQLEEYQSEE